MKYQIKNLEINILSWFIMCSGIIGISFNSYIHIAKTDAWLAPIIGSIIGFALLLIFLKIMNYKDEYNINDILKEKCSKIGKIISILICIFIASFIMIYFYNLINFISSEYLYSTPKLFIAIIFIIPIIYTLLYEIHVISRSIMIFGYIAIFFFICASLSITFQSNPTNLLPFLEHGFKMPLFASLYHVCYIVSPLFLLTIIPKEKIRDNKKFNKKMIITYIISSITVCIIVYSVLASFGIELSLLYQYPVYNILKRISVLSIFDRVESIIAIMWILFIYTTCIIGFYYLKTSFYQITELKENKKNKVFILTLCILLLLFSVVIFPSNTFVNDFLLNIYPFFIAIFFIIIPFLISVFLKTKK